MSKEKIGQGAMAEVALAHLGFVIDEHVEGRISELKNLYLTKNEDLNFYMAKVGELVALDRLKADLNSRVKVGRRHDAQVVSN